MLVFPNIQINVFEKCRDLFSDAVAVAVICANRKGIYFIDLQSVADKSPVDSQPQSSGAAYTSDSANHC